MEEIYAKQPLEFENAEFSNHLFKLDKDLYGLRQVSRAWYERLSKLLLEKSFPMGKVDNTLFTKIYENELLILHELFVVQIYFDGIIFVSTIEFFYKQFYEVSNVRRYLVLKIQRHIQHQ